MDSKKPEQLTIVPFGKYKGKPAEVMLQDQEYLEWLNNQPWFKQKYQNIYIFVNNFNKPTNTPEHNRMQFKFLNEDYRLKTAYKRYGSKIFKYNQSHFEKNIIAFLQMAKPELRGITFEMLINDILKLNGIELIKHEFVNGKSIEFEENGDVKFRIRYGYGHLGVLGDIYDKNKKLYDQFWQYAGYCELKIELKPSVGDDFPAILRQMKAEKSEILIYGQYTGSGVDEQGCIEYFKSQGIFVISEDEIEKLVLPAYDKALKVDVEIIKRSFESLKKLEELGQT